MSAVDQDLQASSPVRPLTLRQLEGLAILGPVVFLSVVYFLVLGPVHPFFHGWVGFFSLGAVLAGAVWAFTRVMFGSVRALQYEVESLSNQTESYNRRLVSLHDANLALARETSVDSALERIVALSRDLLAADQVSLALAEVAEVDDSPSASAPPDDRRLALPVGQRQRPVGTLHVTRSPATEPFSTVDLEIGRMFATHAALVIQNDRLYDEVRVLAIESERHSLAREMHDSLAQVLSFVNMKAQAVELYLRNEDVPAARQQMAELSAAAREVYGDIREGIAALRVEVSGRGIHELVEEYAHQFSETARIEVELEWPADQRWRDLPPAADAQLLRIVQEALSNVRRHAHASTVKLSGLANDESLVLTIADDGRGFTGNEPRSDDWPHFGLQTMEERARAIGGRFEIESAPSAGTTVTVTLPHGAAVADRPAT